MAAGTPVGRGDDPSAAPARRRARARRHRERASGPVREDDDGRFDVVPRARRARSAAMLPARASTGDIDEAGGNAL